MGSSQSSPVLTCQYNKDNFNKQLDIIRDAHDVTQFYANLLIQESLPIKLDEYKNYTGETEDYFNPTRKIVLPDLGSSYYSFYQYLTKTLQSVYEESNNKDQKRREIIMDVFNKALIVQKYIIEDLWDGCNNQGNPIKFTPYSTSPNRI